MKKITLLAVCTLLVATAAPAQQLNEGFEGTFPPASWLVRNQSSPVGTNTNCWNQFTSSTPWTPHTGNGQTGANFNCTSGAGEISGWLITAPLSALQNGNQVSFWTRKASPDNFADRLEVRLCVDSSPDSCGAAGSSGSLAGDVGSFTTLLLSINPTLVLGVYPVAFTQYTATLSGLPAGTSTGRVAFRYWVTSGGPSGDNSDLISIDDVLVTDTTPVSLQSYEVE